MGSLCLPWEGGVGRWQGSAQQEEKGGPGRLRRSLSRSASSPLGSCVGSAGTFRPSGCQRHVLAPQDGGRRRASLPQGRQSPRLSAPPCAHPCATPTPLGSLLPWDIPTSCPQRARPGLSPSPADPPTRRPASSAPDPAGTKLPRPAAPSHPLSLSKFYALISGLSKWVSGSSTVFYLQLGLT